MTIVRGQRALVFPTRFMLAAATNPCPCGFAGVGESCRCSDSDLARHHRKLSGPLLDRMDLLVNVERPTERELHERPLTCSDAVRARVAAARERQHARFAVAAGRSNGALDARFVERLVRLDGASAQVLARAYALGALSARGRHRVLRVAQTIADLRGHCRVREEDMLTALSLRQRGGGQEELARPA